MSDSIGNQTVIDDIRRSGMDGVPCVESTLDGADGSIPVLTNEFWTAKQRAAHSLHEVTYRACFKPQLPRFFIERFTRPGDLVFDPFLGRGTTVIEAALMGRNVAGYDVNPLSKRLISPRLRPPDLWDLERWIDALRLDPIPVDPSDELLAFFHERTLGEILALRKFLALSENQNDRICDWVRMVATNRLTGHSAGFFSVYTLPPNQAVSVRSQLKINEKRNQQAEYRPVLPRILKKSNQLLADVTPMDQRLLEQAAESAQLCTGSSDHLGCIGDSCVSLVVTSPPFLDVIDYKLDNWMRCWFNQIDPDRVTPWQIKKLSEWTAAMTRVMVELRRILKHGGWVAFEVGEVRSASIKLEEEVVKAAMQAGLAPVCILINAQEFTKTSNCWGIDNQSKGTNSNRIVLLQKQN